MSAPPRLHPEDLAALAEMIADRLAHRLAKETRGSDPVLIDAAEVARRFGLSAEWVRDHAADLGAVRLGDGPRPRLRFEPARVTEALSGRVQGRGSESEEVPASSRVPRTRRTRDLDRSPGVLPIFEEYSASTDKIGPGDVGASRGPATRKKPSPRREPTRPGSASGDAGRAPHAENERRP